MLVYLIRHGESEFNRRKLIQGSIDSDLSQLGVAQAGKIGGYLAGRNVARIYTSPAKRACATAEIIQQHTSSRLTKDEGLLECRFGEMEGKNAEGLAKENKQLFFLWKTDPLKLNVEGMEPFDAFYERAKKTFTNIADRSDGSDIAIVTHAGVIGAIACYILNAHPGSITRLLTVNASITVLEQFFHTFALRRFNSVAHLDHL